MDVGNIIYVVLEVVIAITAVVANALVLYIVYKHKHLHSITNYFIANLAAADLLVGLFAIPFALITANGLPYDFYGCLFMNSLVVILTQSSIFSLLSIATERFIAIKEPYRYQRHCGGNFTAWVIICTWLAAIFIGLLPMFGWNLGPNLDGGKCHFMKVIDMQYMVYFNFFACVLAPLVVMLGMYMYIFIIIHKQTKKIASLQVGDGSPQVSDVRNKRVIFLKERRAAKSLVILVVLFAICWLPLHIVNTIKLLCPHCNISLAWFHGAILLSHANSSVNPILYAYMNRKIRFAIGRLWGLKWGEDLEISQIRSSVVRRYGSPGKKKHKLIVITNKRHSKNQSSKQNNSKHCSRHSHSQHSHSQHSHSQHSHSQHSHSQQQHIQQHSIIQQHNLSSQQHNAHNSTHSQHSQNQHISYITQQNPHCPQISESPQNPHCPQNSHSQQISHSNKNTHSQHSKSQQNSYSLQNSSSQHSQQKSHSQQNS
ncbi:unnamed protein product, partial [Owenia fusiformis]